MTEFQFCKSKRAVEMHGHMLQTYLISLSHTTHNAQKGNCRNLFQWQFTGVSFLFLRKKWPRRFYTQTLENTKLRFMEQTWNFLVSVLTSKNLATSSLHHRAELWKFRQMFLTQGHWDKCSRVSGSSLQSSFSEGDVMNIQHQIQVFSLKTAGL